MMRTNGTNFTDNELELLHVMSAFGYACRCDGKMTWRLTAKAIHPFCSAMELPYAFGSVRAAAEHLIPIICDDNYRTAIG